MNKNTFLGVLSSLFINTELIWLDSISDENYDETKINYLFLDIKEAHICIDMRSLISYILMVMNALSNISNVVNKFPTKFLSWNLIVKEKLAEFYSVFNTIHLNHLGIDSL